MIAKCTCPLITKDGHVVRAALDQSCPQHGPKAPVPRYHQNCPSCTCKEPEEPTSHNQEYGQ